MSSYNKVTLIGNVTRDPEVRYTPKGKAVCDVGIAINRKYTTDDGEKREDTTFIDVTVWGKSAEFCGEYVRKGREVFVEGRLVMESWEDKQTGQKRSKMKVFAEQLQPLGAAKQELSPTQKAQAKREEGDDDLAY